MQKLRCQGIVITAITVEGENDRKGEKQTEQETYFCILTQEEAVADLPERDQLLMNLYYVEELNLKEIGEVLGVTESRVSQLLTAVVKKLRGTLKVEPAHVAKPKAGKGP